MPIQTSEKRFVFYKYNPDYLKTKYYLRTITNVNRVGNIECLRQDGEVFDLDLVIDGGNVVRCDDKIVMTGRATKFNVYWRKLSNVTLYSFHGTEKKFSDIVMV